MDAGSRSCYKAGLDMDAISLVVGAAAIAAVVVFSVMESRAQEQARKTCSRLDSCPIRQQEIAERQVRGR
jgi:uncharacterized protein (UPF0212 family)